MTEFRDKVRKSLKQNNQLILSDYITSKNFNSAKFNILYNSSTDLSSSFLAMLGQRFPVFLTPSPSFNIDDLINNPTIRICWDNEYWYIVKHDANCRSLDENNILFSFDLPDELFNLYADNDMLTQSNALNLKEELMSTIQIIFKNQTQSIMSSLELRLDSEWIENIRQHIDTEDI